MGLQWVRHDWVTKLNWTVQSMKFSSQNTGVDRASLLQYIFTSQVSCLSGKFFTSRATGKSQNTGVGSVSLFQWIFPTQGFNQGLVYCRQILYKLNSQGNSCIYMIVIHFFFLAVYITSWPSISFFFLWLKNIFLFFFSFFFFYCSGFCHTLKWNSHGFTCVPHPDTPSHLPLHPISLGLPSAPGPSACLMHPTWAGDLFHPR